MVRIWVFKKGEAVPSWLEKIKPRRKKGILTFCDTVLVVKKQKTFYVFPVNSGFAMILDPKASNLTIEGQGEGVNFYGSLDKFIEDIAD